MTPSRQYVGEDAHGAWRVGETRISLDSVVYAFLQGHSAEAIQDQYPALSLEEVYGAIAFYLANRDEIHEYLERQEKVWADFRAQVEQKPSAVVERLRAMKAEAARDKR